MGSVCPLIHPRRAELQVFQQARAGVHLAPHPSPFEGKGREGQKQGRLVIVRADGDRYVKLPLGQAAGLWTERHAAAGQVSGPGSRCRTLFIIGGLVLPLWSVLERILNRQTRVADRKLAIIRLQLTGLSHPFRLSPSWPLPSTCASLRSCVCVRVCGGGGIGRRVCLQVCVLCSVLLALFGTGLGCLGMLYWVFDVVCLHNMPCQEHAS